MSLLDPFGRRINYLRLSVTDRCNLRCTYCMPATGMVKVSHDDILSYEELLRIARAAVAIGVEKIRVTSRGIAKSCLFDRGTLDLRPLLAGGDEAALCEALRRVVAEKPDRHQLAESVSALRQMLMAQIGG